jgi:hypothetical protein
MKQFTLSLLALLVYVAGDAQLTNTGVFYVGNSTVISLGDFTNNGSFMNNGTTYYTGNVTNTEVGMPAGTGTFIFAGTSAQTISGGAPFRTLNFTMNNAAGIILNTRLAIGDGTGGTLTFTTGHITSGGSTKDVYFYPGSGYTGFSAASHIIGYTTKSGTSDFVFPIGDGTHTAAIGLSALTGTADFQALYTGAGYGTYTFNVPLVPGGVFDQEYWTLTPTQGFSSGKITLNWDDSRKHLNNSNPGSLVVAHFSGGAWSSVGGSSSNSAGSSTGSVGPSNLVSSFSPFTFGSTVVALPILLADFTVTNENCQAYLSWTTTLEHNAASFDIQQSTDGTNFTTVSTVKAEDTPATYHATIAQVAQQAFYRLRLVDLDGSAVYSLIDGLALGCLPATDHLELYPNPVPSGSTLQARLTTPVARGMAQLQVFDGVGRKVFSTMVMVNAGANSYTLPAGSFAKGIYNVVVMGESWKSDIISFSR